MTKIIFELKNISKSYKTGDQTLQVLQKLNLQIQTQQSVAIIGESGSGKSTLMHIASLLDSFDNGKILLNNKEIHKLNDKQKSKIRNKNFGFVYQSHMLLKEFNILENILMPILIERRIKKDDINRAESLLKRLDVLEQKDKFPSELSGGQQQRVAIARALIQSPKIIFADEPTGNLDPQTAKIVKDLFDHLIREEKISLVMVTHDHAIAKLCDCIYKLEAMRLVQ